MQKGAENRKDGPRVRRGLTVVARHETRDQICILENASRLGAGLRINPHFQLPRRFSLVLADMTVPVVLRWRHLERAGVKFDLPGNDRPLVHRLLTGIRPDAG